MTIDNPTQLAHKPNFINSEFVNAVEFFTATKAEIGKAMIVENSRAFKETFKDKKIISYKF